jgi:hypothetical protein
LAKHPNQLITNVGLLFRSAKSGSQYKYEFMLQVRMRGKIETMRTVGVCRGAEGADLRCSVECDGGGVNVKVRPHHLMMYLDRIRMASCGKDPVNIENTEEISGGIDDREFRINRFDDAMCSDMHFE